MLHSRKQPLSGDAASGLAYSSVLKEPEQQRNFGASIHPIWIVIKMITINQHLTIARSSPISEAFTQHRQAMANEIKLFFWNREAGKDGRRADISGADGVDN